MKTTLTFGDDEEHAALDAMRATDYACAIDEIYQMFRGYVKHGDYGHEASDVLARIYEEFFEIAGDYLDR